MYMYVTLPSCYIDKRIQYQAENIPSMLNPTNPTTPSPKKKIHYQDTPISKKNYRITQNGDMYLLKLPLNFNSMVKNIFSGLKIKRVDSQVSIYIYALTSKSTKNSYNKPGLNEVVQRLSSDSAKYTTHTRKSREV